MLERGTGENRRGDWQQHLCERVSHMQRHGLRPAYLQNAEGCCRAGHVLWWVTRLVRSASAHVGVSGAYCAVVG